MSFRVYFFVGGLLCFLGKGLWFNIGSLLKF